MANVAFELTQDMFGTNVCMIDPKTGDRTEICQGLQVQDPLAKMNPRLKKGYLFRRPSIPNDEWDSVLSALSKCDGAFNLWAKLEGKERDKVVAYARFEDQGDAAMFAWSHGTTWQKWSDEQEKQSRKKSDDAAKIFVDKDGKVKATVKATVLGK